MHFPTDLNLLWDSLRKGIDVVEKLLKINEVKGWRKIKQLRSSTKSLFRQASQQVFRSNGKNEKQRTRAVKRYLQQSNMLQERFEELIAAPPAGINLKRILLYVTALKQYNAYAKKFTDQIARRLLKKEVIPACEKVFSIFEEHTECLPDCAIQAGITKGKLNKKVELGHLLLITTDQYHLIVDYKIMQGEKDAAQVAPLTKRIQQNYAGKKISSHSFDKSFYSQANLDSLQQSYTAGAVLPKSGRHSKEGREREGTKSFK